MFEEKEGKMTDPNAVNSGVPNEENAGASGQSEGYDAQSFQPFGGSPYSQAPQQQPQQPYAQPTQFKPQQPQQPYYGQPSSAAGYTPYGQSAQPQGQAPQQPYGQPAQSSFSPYGQPAQPAQATQSSSAPYGQPSQPTQPGPQQPYAQPQSGPTPPYAQQPQSGPIPPYGGGSANYSYANNGVPVSPMPAGMPTGEPPLWAPYYGISFVEAVKRFFKKYATFTGRASRSEYWWVYLFTLIVAVAFSILSAATDESAVISALEGLWGLAIIVPNFALSIRRLHDQNKSGWWLLLPYGLYLLGAIIWLIGGVSAVAGFGADPSGMSVGTGVGLGMMVLGIIPLLAGFVLNILLFVGASKPEGSRYDVPQP